MAWIVHSAVECSKVLAFNNLPFTILTNNQQRSFFLKHILICYKQEPTKNDTQKQTNLSKKKF